MSGINDVSEEQEKCVYYLLAAVFEVVWAVQVLKIR